MIRNKALKISVIKNDEQEVKENPYDNFYMRVEYIHDAVKDVGKKFAIGLASYVVLDTLRKVAVEFAKK